MSSQNGFVDISTYFVFILRFWQAELSLPPFSPFLDRLNLSQLLSVCHVMLCACVCECARNAVQLHILYCKMSANFLPTAPCSLFSFFQYSNHILLSPTPTNLATDKTHTSTLYVYSCPTHITNPEVMALKHKHLFK